MDGQIEGCLGGWASGCALEGYMARKMDGRIGLICLCQSTPWNGREWVDEGADSRSDYGLPLAALERGL